MGPWTALGLLKLFLDVIEGGPVAIVKGILMSGVPYNEVLDIGEVVFGLFNLDGSYSGTVVCSRDEYVPPGNLEIVNRDEFEESISLHNFPRLAELEFAKMRKMEFPNMKEREFPKLGEIADD